MQMCVWHILSGCRAIRQRKRDAIALHGSPSEDGCHALAAECNFGYLSCRELRERLRVSARDDERVTCISRTDIEKRDHQA